jgi:hypothetical protein
MDTTEGPLDPIRACTNEGEAGSVRVDEKVEDDERAGDETKGEDDNGEDDDESQGWGEDDSELCTSGHFILLVPID